MSDGKEGRLKSAFRGVTIILPSTPDPPHLCPRHPVLLVNMYVYLHKYLHAQRAVLQICIGTKLQSCGRPAPSVSRYETSILSRFFWSPKTAFFGPFLALIQSFFCHFCDTSRNWTFLLSEFPLIQTFWDRFYETLRLPRLTKSTRFLTVRTRHGPNLRVDF